MEADRPLGSATTYATWGDQIATQAAPLLPAGIPATKSTSESIAWQWAPANDILTYDAANRENAERLHEISERARKRFFGQFAGVTLINDGVQYHPAARGLNPSRVPLELSYCNVAIQQSEPLVVGNGRMDERFKNNPYLEQVNLPFYAGLPMHDRQGEVIGSFCVMSAIPRPASTFPVDELKKYAAEAQAELWRIEDAPHQNSCLKRFSVLLRGLQQ